MRPNLVHLDCGFRTRLSNDDLFMVVCPSPTPPNQPSTVWASNGRGGLAGQVGLAISSTQLDVTAVVRELAPKLLISAGHGPFLDKSFSHESPSGELISCRAIVFGNRGGRRVDHAIVYLNDGTVRFLSEREVDGEA